MNETWILNLKIDCCWATVVNRNVWKVNVMIELMLWRLARWKLWGREQNTLHFISVVHNRLLLQTGSQRIQDSHFHYTYIWSDNFIVRVPIHKSAPSLPSLYCYLYLDVKNGSRALVQLRCRRYTILQHTVSRMEPEIERLRTGRLYLWLRPQLKGYPAEAIVKVPQVHRNGSIS